MILRWEAELATPLSPVTGYTYSQAPRRPETARSATAEAGGGVNFESDPRCNVMNQEAGLLHQLFMQIFGCSLSPKTWKEWVLKTLLHCRALLNPFPPREWERSVCPPAHVTSLRFDQINSVLGLELPRGVL